LGGTCILLPLIPCSFVCNKCIIHSFGHDMFPVFWFMRDLQTDRNAWNSLSYKSALYKLTVIVRHC
jgi:hypothetical protein